MDKAQGEIKGKIRVAANAVCRGNGKAGPGMSVVVVVCHGRGIGISRSNRDVVCLRAIKTVYRFWGVYTLVDCCFWPEIGRLKTSETPKAQGQKDEQKLLLDSAPKATPVRRRHDPGREQSAVGSRSRQESLGYR